MLVAFTAETLASNPPKPGDALYCPQHLLARTAVPLEGQEVFSLARTAPCSACDEYAQVWKRSHMSDKQKAKALNSTAAASDSKAVPAAGSSPPKPGSALLLSPNSKSEVSAAAGASDQKDFKSAPSSAGAGSSAASAAAEPDSWFFDQAQTVCFPVRRAPLSTASPKKKSVHHSPTTAAADSKSAGSSLVDLPCDVLARVMSFGRLAEVVRCAVVCKSLQAEVKDVIREMDTLDLKWYRTHQRLCVCMYSCADQRCA